MSLDRLHEIITDEPSTWEEAWKEEVTPWDRKKPQIALKNVLESFTEFPKVGKALVPGCGKGYDAFLIAEKLGLEVTGLEVSATAAEQSKVLAENYPENVRAKVAVTLEDFFQYSPSDPFDLVYDYTFFVAIPPTRRPEWGTQMQKLVKPGGFLITLMFPLVEAHDTGPPFWIEYEHYTKALGRESWKKVLDEIPEVEDESHRGKYRLAVWEKL